MKTFMLVSWTYLVTKLPPQLKNRVIPSMFRIQLVCRRSLPKVVAKEPDTSPKQANCTPSCSQWNVSIILILPAYFDYPLQSNIPGLTYSTYLRIPNITFWINSFLFTSSKCAFVVFYFRISYPVPAHTLRRIWSVPPLAQRRATNRLCSLGHSPCWVDGHSTPGSTDQWCTWSPKPDSLRIQEWPIIKLLFNSRRRGNQTTAVAYTGGMAMAAEMVRSENVPDEWE